MEIKKLAKSDVDELCQTVTKRLLDANESSNFFDGIENKEALMQTYMTIQLLYWRRTGEVWVIGDNQGMLAGHYKENIGWGAALAMVKEMIKQVWQVLDKKDRKQLIRNAKNAAGTENIGWRKEVTHGQNYYYIDFIIIDERLAGTGAFRKLMDPIIERMAKEKVPILLDTHDENNVPIYRHFGFELVRKHKAENKKGLVQYSMIKRS